MPKIREVQPKQARLESFFGALNKNENSDILKTTNQGNNNTKRSTIEISSDDDTPKKKIGSKLYNNNDLKENLVKLSNEMESDKPKSSFSFKSKSVVKEKTLSSEKPSNNSEVKQNSTVKPKILPNGKSKFEYIDTDDEDDILPISTTQKNHQEIKPQPLFKITTKPLKALETTTLFTLKPKFTSNIDKILQEERDKNVYIANAQNVTKAETATSQNIFEYEEENKPNSQDRGFSDGLNSSDSSKKFQFRKPSSQEMTESPKKSSESLKILDQLSTAISSIRNSTSPIINVNSLEKNNSNTSTPELKAENKRKSINDTSMSRLNVKLEPDEVIEEINQFNASIDDLELQQLIMQKLKFLEYYFISHSSIPLTTFDAVEGYNKTLTVKLKGVIQSIDRRQKSKENKQDKNRISNAPTKPIKLPSPQNQQSSFSRIPNHTYNNNDDDQFDIDQILNDIEDEKNRAVGKFDNSYVDITKDSSFNVKFEPRINMKTSMPASATLPVMKKNNFVDTDEDGFPIIDLSQLEDVIPSQPMPSTSRQSKETLKGAKIDTVDSMIPDNITDIKVTNSKTGIGNFLSNVKNDGITGEFDGENYEFSSELRCSFRTIFGLKKFRQNQLQAINATLLGKDCFILMPTGGGKSLCYQLTAVMSKGVTIVISPLKSLILDQVNKLNSLDIKAAAISGTVSQAAIKEIYRDLNLNNPTIKLLYVTPEKISASAFFQDTLTSLYNKGNLARIVIDEAHCVSTWGHDFRPDYKRLGELKRRFPSVPCMALTATANERVRADVVHQLGIFNCKWFLSSFNRPNLKYIVTTKTGSKTVTEIINLIKSKFPKSSGIVYCLSRKECEQVAQKLEMSNIKAVSYHAGMTDKAREKAQEDWITDKYRVVCATIAFGMGIDKPDVRFVIHYSIPKSIEGYYQESGRAGRDGALSTCILYYSYSDKVRLANMMSDEPQAVKQVSMNNLDLVVSFCENMLDCRRTLQLNYFGEKFTREQCLENRESACDNCTRVLKYKNIDVTEIAKNIVKAVNELCARFGLTILQLVDVFKGAMTKKVTDAGHHNTRFHGILKDWERNDIQRIIHKLVIENYLREEITVIKDIPISYVKVGKNVAQLMNQNRKVEFSIMEKKSSVTKKADMDIKNDRVRDTMVDELQDRLYHDLMDIAKAIADERNLTIQQVINMEALRQMSRVMPETEEEMMQIPHITKANFMKYGKRFLDAIIPYSAQRSVYDIDLAEVDDDNFVVDDNNDDDEDGSQEWEAIGQNASTSTGRGSYKRRGGGSSWGKFNRAKKFKRSRSGTKKKNTSITKSKATKKALMPPPRPTF